MVRCDNSVTPREQHLREPSRLVYGPVGPAWVCDDGVTPEDQQFAGALTLQAQQQAVWKGQLRCVMIVSRKRGAV